MVSPYKTGLFAGLDVYGPTEPCNSFVTTFRDLSKFTRDFPPDSIYTIRRTDMKNISRPIGEANQMTVCYGLEAFFSNPDFNKKASPRDLQDRRCVELPSVRIRKKQTDTYIIISVKAYIK